MHLISLYHPSLTAGHYLPGLENLAMQRGNHVTKEYVAPDLPFGVPPLPVTLTELKMDCRFVLKIREHLLNDLDG